METLYRVALIALILIAVGLTHRTMLAHVDPEEAYFDNNATTKPFKHALDMMARVAYVTYGNPSSPHALGRRADRLLEECRHDLARMLGARSPHQLVFTSGATESNNLALRGRIMLHNNKKPHVLCTPIEHASVSATLKDMDIDVETVRVDSLGRVDLADLRAKARPSTALFCVIAANNEIGTIQDMRAIVEACRSKGVPVHADMTQMAGKYFLDLEGSGVDSATISAHKFHGPRGVGLLYLRQGKTLRPCQTGGHQEGSMRAGTENLAGVVGMASALYTCHDLIVTGEQKRVEAMRDYVRAQIRRMCPKARFNGDPDSSLYSTLSVTLDKSARDVVAMLSDAGVYVGTGSACSNTDGGSSSETLRAIGLSDADAQRTIRISLSFTNNMRQCRKLAACMERILGLVKYRMVSHTAIARGQ